MWTRSELKDRCKVVMKRNYWMMLLVTFIYALLNSNTNVSINFTQVTTTISNLGMYFHEGFNISPMMTSFFAGIPLLGFLIRCFITNPIQCGLHRFFIHNIEENQNVSVLFFAFQKDYLNVVKILFIRDLKTALWSLLLIFPGIYKGYEYRMIAPLLSQDPSMDMKEAFEKSKKMTNNEILNMFILDLSFIGWRILGSLIIIGNYFVDPYYYGVQAELYTQLKTKLAA